jgi:cardiolipin synthase
MTPYMILDEELKNAIRFAAGRGVDVSIILPGIPDKKVAYALAKSHYKDLLDAGISIYEYTPGFVHSKVFVSDDEKAVVGTINLDYRSLYHHFECATYIEEADCISDIEADFQKTIPECRAVSYESVKHEKLLYKLVGGVVKTMAPLI